MDFEEIFEDMLMPALFVADVRIYSDRIEGKSRLGTVVMDFLEEKVGKEKADEFRDYINKQLDKHDISGLLNDIIDEFNRINGVKNTVKVDYKALQEQLDEDE